MRVILSLRSLPAQTPATILAALFAAPASWLAAVESTPELSNPGRVSVSKQEQKKLGLKVTVEVYQQIFCLILTGSPGTCNRLASGCRRSSRRRLA